MNKNKFNRCAPIAVFCYKRLDHLKLCINSLIKNEEINFSEVYFFCDNYKSERDADDVKKVREFVKSVKLPKKMLFLGIPTLVYKKYSYRYCGSFQKQ